MSTDTTAPAALDEPARDGVAPGGAPAAPTGPGADIRIGPRAHLRHTGALVRRNLLWIRQDPESMMDAVLMPIIFTILFVFVFGGAIAGKGNQDDYVNYVVPGLMAMMAMNITMGVGTGFNQDFQSGVMDRFRTLPIARSSVLIAKIVVEICRMLVATTILLIVGFMLGLSVSNVPGMFAAVGLALVFGSATMWIFLTMGVVMKSAQAIQGMGFLVLMPLQFGSSIFAPTKDMPDWLQTFTDYNPLSSLADASRGLFNGGAIAHDVWVTLIWSFAITAIMAPIAIHKFRTKS
ncbi:ABC transporter permease [Streptomyces sp. NA04227]|uniref:ABC transporter permease n=1 Tax=Streptomyces sp. NA04227 TaxID=2742136 RepID=UPI0015919C66|nr:ABC transporter permease [Streptomyces sp. NA04227]QKW06134.1 ABC transporter permease [Streptomyces sp. NA04227]